MPNLVQELGSSYFAEFFTGALFLHDNDVMQLETCDSQTVTARRITPTDIGDRRAIPADFFTGYKTFEYPILGYRRLNEHRIGYLSRRQTTARGLRLASINVAPSPASSLLRELAVVPHSSSHLAELQKGVAAFKPTFDSLRDLPELLSGQKFGLVLSPTIMIEASTSAASDWFSIYYKESLIGKLNARGVVTWTSPLYASLLPELG